MLAAAALSLLVLMTWSVVVQILYKPKGKVVSPSPPKEVVPIPHVRVGGGKDIVVETERMVVVLSSFGARVKSWRLKGHRADVGKGLYDLVFSPSESGAALLVAEGWVEGEWSFERKGYEVRFWRDIPPGLHVEKRYVFSSGGYDVGLFVSLENRSGSEVSLGRLCLSWWPGPIPIKGMARYHSAAWKVDGEVKRGVPKDKGAFAYYPGKVSWVAYKDKYFCAILFDFGSSRRAYVRNLGSGREVGLYIGFLRLSPGARKVFKFSIYGGPQIEGLLKPFGAEGVIDYGTFGWISKIMILLLNLFHRLTGNYGVAIIFLTILTKIVFWPLYQKSVKSTKAMQELQPQINALREKYGKNPQRLQRELMRLYKEKGVSPLGGCLPILIQFPVFLALYSALTNAVELRGSGFVLWIKDLSVRDPYYVLPILMGITMIVQQRQTPSDPRTSRIMTMTTLIFVVMFLGLPSGVVLYWFVMNLLNIAQQYLVTRRIW
jgi:YidC/Oxa1 family membrane protein insertase